MHHPVGSYSEHNVQMHVYVSRPSYPGLSGERTQYVSDAPGFKLQLGFKLQVIRGKFFHFSQRPLMSGGLHSSTLSFTWHLQEPVRLA